MVRVVSLARRYQVALLLLVLSVVSGAASVAHAAAVTVSTPTSSGSLFDATTALAAVGATVMSNAAPVLAIVIAFVAIRVAKHVIGMAGSRK